MERVSRGAFARCATHNGSTWLVPGPCLTHSQTSLRMWFRVFNLCSPRSFWGFLWFLEVFFIFFFKVWFFSLFLLVFVSGFFLRKKWGFLGQIDIFHIFLEEFSSFSSQNQDFFPEMEMLQFCGGGGWDFRFFSRLFFSDCLKMLYFFEGKCVFFFFQIEKCIFMCFLSKLWASAFLVSLTL